jgi:hypothetical protein
MESWEGSIDAENPQKTRKHKTRHGRDALCIPVLAKYSVVARFPRLADVVSAQN